MIELVKYYHGRIVAIKSPKASFIKQIYTRVVAYYSE